MLLLDILKNTPGQRLMLVDFVVSPGFRSLEGPTQTEVLKRIIRYGKPDTLNNIKHLTNLVTWTGFDVLPTSSQKLMLRALGARPKDEQLSLDLSWLAGSPRFRNLDVPTQTWVLKRIEGYAGNRNKIHNLQLLITTTPIDQLSKESRNAMLVAFANHPNDEGLLLNFERLHRTGINIRQLDQPTQTDVINRIVAYPRDPRTPMAFRLMDNLMTLVTTPAFGNVVGEVRAEILDGLPSRFANVDLNPLIIGNLMTVVTTFSFTRILPEFRALLLDFQAERPDNAQLANALANIPYGKLRDRRTAHQTISQVNYSIP
jgi:hypothetical protein